MATRSQNPETPTSDPVTTHPQDEPGIAVPNSAGKTITDGQDYNEAVLKDAKIADLEKQLFAAQQEQLKASTVTLTSEGGTKVAVPADQVAGLKSLGFTK